MRTELGHVAQDEADVVEAAPDALGLRDLERPARSVDADGLAHAGREQEADVAARRAEVEQDAFRRRERRESASERMSRSRSRHLRSGAANAVTRCRPVEVLVGIELGLERHGDILGVTVRSPPRRSARVCGPRRAVVRGSSRRVRAGPYNVPQ